ncbi:MAG: dihydropteroate synthase [Actinomycetota bacterium]|nr:dihydropteroate synthase [Actinomycetota bacterium]
MAVINRTPDSFYDKGRHYCFSDALRAVDTAVADGADIIDIGGIKAAPGPKVPVHQEIERVVPLVTEIRRSYPRIIISIDTWRSEVAVVSAEAGANLINDAWGGYDPNLAKVAARYGCGLVCTHAGTLKPRTEARGLNYTDVVLDVKSRLSELADRAVCLGVAKESILVDPGHDFAKNTRHSLEVTRRIDEIVGVGWPVLVAVSNKDFIGESLGLPVTERLEGTLAVISLCAWMGVRVFRVHNVKEARRAIDMVSVVMGKKEPLIAKRATT